MEIAYHLDGVDNLRLTGELVADIYLGRVTKWNDARIASVNPGVSLPDKEIYPVFRLDGSGTTYVFTHYLSSVSPAWAESVGTGKSLTFPRGVAATGTAGVAGLVEKIPRRHRLRGFGLLRLVRHPACLAPECRGQLRPTLDREYHGGACPANRRHERDADRQSRRRSLSDQLFLVGNALPRPELFGPHARAGRTDGLAVLRWLVGPEAQNLAAREHYAPLPTAVAARAVELLDSVTYGGKPLK